MGLAVGDAFGGRYEFMDEPTCRASLERDYDPRMRLVPVLGAGAHRLNPGQITDDTEMALCLAESLSRGAGYSADGAAANYVAWLLSGPVDVGNATRNALSLSDNDPSVADLSVPGAPRWNTSPAQVVSSNANFKNRQALSNGSLMRLAPLAIAGSTVSEETFLQWVEIDCRLTHPHPLVVDACRVYANCVRAAIVTGDREKVVRAARRTPQTNAVSRIVSEALTPSSHQENAGGFLYFASEHAAPTRIRADDEKMGYFGIALHCALHELAYGSHFSRAIERVVSRGGDTDTNACITGALVGALHGIASIPNEWKIAVMNGIQRTGRPFQGFLFDMADALMATPNNRA